MNLIGAVALLFFISWKLTFGVLAIVPAVIAPLFLVGGLVRRLSVRAQDRLADAVAYAGESLDQLETVQAFGREKASGAAFAHALVPGVHKTTVSTAIRGMAQEMGGRAEEAKQSRMRDAGVWDVGL